MQAYDWVRSPRPGNAKYWVRQLYFHSPTRRILNSILLTQPEKQLKIAIKLCVLAGKNNILKKLSRRTNHTLLHNNNRERGGRQHPADLSKRMPSRQRPVILASLPHFASPECKPGTKKLTFLSHWSWYRIENIVATDIIAVVGLFGNPPVSFMLTKVTELALSLRFGSN